MIEEALVSLETWEKVLLATFSNLVLENNAEEQELLRERFASESRPCDRASTT